MWKKELLITKHIYPIKVGWVTRQESPLSNKRSQLGSWLGSLAGEWEKLTGSHSENRTTGHISDHLWEVKGTWLSTWGAVAMAAPGARSGKGIVLNLRNDHEQAGWNHCGGCEEQDRANDSLWNDYAFNFFPKVRKATKFSGEIVWRDLLWFGVGEKQNLQSNRKDPPPQKTDSTTENNFLFQIPAFQRMTNKDHCSKIIAACLGVTLLA